MSNTDEITNHTVTTGMIYSKRFKTMEKIQLTVSNTIELSKRELYILHCIVGEMYEDVCVDAYEFEIIHGVEKNEVLVLQKKLQDFYKNFETVSD